MKNVLIVGGTRGLGKALVAAYTAQPHTNVLATARYSSPERSGGKEQWVGEVDIGREDAGQRIASQYPLDGPLDIVIVSAGYFATDTLEAPDWTAQLQMFSTSAIGPVFLVHHLLRAKLLGPAAKLVLVSSESGSIALRHEKEGGGNYGHHASKAAENMVGKLLSLDLKEKGVAVAIVHPGFMRTEMTKGVGFDKFWDAGGAVTPENAAKSLVDWIETFDMSKTGQYWAPRGAGDIGTADVVLGPKDTLPTPLQLPW